jgi:Domain of unknown function (DUF4365)
MLPRNQRMELLSKAYVRVIAANAGCSCHELESDFGIDLELRGIVWEDRRYLDIGVLVDAQLKSTTLNGVRITDDHIYYELTARNYQHLRKDVGRLPPRLLVLFLMPDKEEHWLHQDSEGITLRHCCYYLSLDGFPATTNIRTVTVAIPRINVFSASYLQKLLQERKQS